MASQTQNYHYPKPEEEDFYDVGEFNRAMDMIDEDIKQVEEAIPAAVRVKGAAESSYRTGDVNITPENIGLGNVPNVSTNNQTPTFTQASTRVNIINGEKLSVIFGKIMKWFADLKTVAFSGKYTDLTDRPTIPAAVRVKGNAESAYRTGDVNLTSANIGAVAKSGDIMTGELIPSGGVKYVGRDNYIVYPDDGYLDTPNASTNNLGFLRVTLPVSWTTTMLKFVVTIYDYLAGETTDYHISGYNYGAGNAWICCTATCVGKAGAYHSNLPVSFGHDGNKCAITIGNSNTSWHYPIVKVHDILLGRFESDFSKWKTGWTASIDTNPLPTVNVTINNTHVAYGSVSSSCTGNAASATKATQDSNGKVIKDTYLPLSGGTITGNLRLKGSGNYGNILNFGDSDYVHISEPTDDHLEIKGSYINFVTSATGTGRFTLNGKDILTIDKIYPVGSIYMSVNSTNPGTLFGGTWVRWGNGRALVSVNESETEFNSVEKVGGEKTHVITTAEMPSHTHSVKAQTVTTSTNGKHTHSGHSNQDIASGTSSKNRIVKGGDNTVSGFLLENGDHSHTVTIPASTTGSTGSGVGHNNLPPYITCYMWKRTA